MPLLIDDLTVTVNNEATSGEVRVYNAAPVFNWSYTKQRIAVPDDEGGLASETFVEQSSFHLKVSSSSAGLGEYALLGDIVDTGAVKSSRSSYAYSGGMLQRGKVYYGQVRVTDEAGLASGWTTFLFRFNSLPTVADVAIAPSSPSVGTDLMLSYTCLDADADVESGTRIRWFRNGVQERAYDDSVIVAGTDLQPGDNWTADVLPSDGFELGLRATASSVSVSAEIPLASGTEGVRVLPEQPNENDILRAEYVFSGESDRSLIRWYINNILQKDFNDQREPRLDLSVGDEVYFTLTPSDGTSVGMTLFSNRVEVGRAPAVAYRIQVEGRLEPLSVLTTRPVVTWSIRKPKGRQPDAVLLRIGTAPGAGNTISATLDGEAISYRVPANKLARGGDYWVSIAVIESGSVEAYTTSHFRLSGSRWAASVDNETGWTVELSFVVDQSATYSDDKYQVVVFQDGSYYGEVRIYRDRIGFKSLGETHFSAARDLDGLKTLTIVGKNNDLKVYVDRVEVIDATDGLMRESTSKKLQVGVPSGLDSSLEVSLRSVFYTTSGAYYPGLNLEYNEYIFSALMDFPNSDLVAIRGFGTSSSNEKVIGVNPHDETRGGSIVKLTTGVAERYPTVNRTFSPINRIQFSPDQRYTVFAHARGVSIFDSYYIPEFDHDADFASAAMRPEQQGWDLVQNVGVDAVSFNDGLVVDTSFSKTGVISVV